MTFPFHHIRHLLVDLDGVLYRGDTALEGAQSFISFLHRKDIAVRLVTNNATLTPAQYVAKLEDMHIDAHEDEIFTSALATCLYLEDQSQRGKTAFVIGEDGLVDAMQRANIRPAKDRPDWVIVGLDRQVTYEKLSIAALAIQAGARFLGTNPDRSLPTEQGLVPGAGAILAALVATTGVEPIVVGKPEPLMLELAMKQLGGSVRDTAILGDRLDTDIQAANALGMPSILVLTGVSTRADLEKGSIKPSLVARDLPELITIWS